eukprot:1184893-Rhodomonas_salina.1
MGPYASSRLVIIQPACILMTIVLPKKFAEEGKSAELQSDATPELTIFQCAHRISLRMGAGANQHLVRVHDFACFDAGHLGETNPSRSGVADREELGRMALAAHPRAEAHAGEATRTRPLIIVPTGRRIPELLPCIFSATRLALSTLLQSALLSRWFAPA